MTAKVVTCFNQKGGAGKTTLSVHLAVGFSRRGFRTLLVDVDPQGTALRWAKEAEGAFPTAVMGLAELGGKVHRELAKYVEDYDVVVVDCPPSADSPTPSSVMLVSDLALIPVIPSPADLWAAEAAKELAHKSKAVNEALLVRTVPNIVQGHTKMAKDALQLLSEDSEVPRTTATIGMRAAFKECALTGTTVHTLPRAKEATEEVEELVTEVLSLLGLRKNKGRGNSK